MNDLDFGVYSLFQLMKDMPGLLIERIRHFIPTKKNTEARQWVNNNYEELDMVDASCNLLIVNRLAFSGIQKANLILRQDGLRIIRSREKTFK